MLIEESPLIVAKVKLVSKGRVQRTSLLTLIRIGVDSQCKNKLAVESLFRLKLQLKNRTQWADE
jgi:hypothetical protein